jgi:hypothetical protein
MGSQHGQPGQPCLGSGSGSVCESINHKGHEGTRRKPSFLHDPGTFTELSESVLNFECLILKPR